MGQSDQRPPVAVGHVAIEVSNVAQAAASFVQLGMRHIHEAESFAVLELRGGTHLVVRASGEAIESSRKAPFDLMVDDIDATRLDYLEKGFEASEIGRGRIHDSFHITGPDGYQITITSSHASDRAV